MLEQATKPAEDALAEVRALIERRSGILFDASRERFFAPRVRDFMSARKLERAAELVHLLHTSPGEYDQLLEGLLTQETSFFRYPAIYEALEKKILPELHIKKFWENPRNLRIWSAGCATGEEPYSIAMAVMDAFEFPEAWKTYILATDISRRALEDAQRGVYPMREVASVDRRRLETYFSRIGDQVMVKPKLRNMVSFAPMNLADPVYAGRFDCIFCMNVLIYFSGEKRAQVVQRFHDALEPGGYLFLGHADSLAGLPVKFETSVYGDCLIYQRPAQNAGSAEEVR
jgi:chemotaxis protein methyltransferase CheR